MGDLIWTVHIGIRTARGTTAKADVENDTYELVATSLGRRCPRGGPLKLKAHNHNRTERTTTMTTLSTRAVSGADAATELTDGYHLVVEALKLNDVRTIYGVVGIPITDVARVAQASGHPLHRLPA